MHPALTIVSLLLCALPLHAAVCAATPQAAAQSAFETPADALPATAEKGYRVQDVQVDAVMHRVYVRVSHCGDPGEPLVLVPLYASLASSAPVVQNVASNALGEPVSTSSAVLVAAVHSGDAVKIVFASQSVQMELEGTADTPAALGESISVTLRRRGDEPPHRIRGVLRANHQVEVQP